MYGSSLRIETRRPRALNRRPTLAAVMPLPNEEVTPPVTKTYFAIGLRPPGVFRMLAIRPGACTTYWRRRSRGGRCAPPIGPMLEAKRRNYGSAGAVGRDRLEPPREAVAGAVADVDENDLRAVGRPVAVERFLVPTTDVLARTGQAMVVGQIDEVRPIGIGKHHVLDVARRSRARPEDKPRSIR